MGVLIMLMMIMGMRVMMMMMMMMMMGMVIFLVPTQALLPPSPVACSSNGTACVASNAYGMWPDRSLCKAEAVVYPTTEAQLLAAVAGAVRRRQKMKVISASSHSIPKWVCPGTGNGEGLLISTRDYNANILINASAMTVTADSGVSLRRLIDVAALKGLALPHSPYWEGVSLGGLLSTGSHGSSFFGKGGAVHDHVTGMSVVVPAPAAQGYAKVINITPRSGSLMNAARVSLGVLGVISQVTLQLEPLFKRSVTNIVKNDSSLEDDILPFSLQHEFGDITWYPSQNIAIYKEDHRVPTNTSGNGLNDFIGFQPQLPVILYLIRSTEEILEKGESSKGKCAVAKVQVSTILSIGRGFKNNDYLFLKYPVVGYQNRMQTSGTCLHSSSSSPEVCAWDPRVKGEFFFETAFYISTANIKSFIADVKRLRDLSDSSSFCGMDMYNGMIVRYVKRSSAYLGAPEDSVEINLNYYRGKDQVAPRLHEDIWEEIEQMAAFKYHGIPAWPKNRNLAFRGASLKYPSMSAFLKVKSSLDPDGLFSSDWSDAILLGKDAQVMKGGDQCALEGLCQCSEDRHCAPEKGYFCREGRVFKEARVCRLDH